jgi:membrane protease YdiL (CAAX protease family)
VPLTCLIFAASHSIIAFRWWHFAIFFPSLVFGWLRDRTGGLVAPVLFHAASNLAMRHIGQLYR